MSSSESLNHTYLWATGSSAKTIAPGDLVAGRYLAIAPQLWRDTQPNRPPQVPKPLTGDVIPYLRLYPHSLHVPGVYGICQSTPESTPILLLNNIPVNTKGKLYPTILEAWSQATPLRQVYWIWQLLELWTPLSELGVAASLLVADNLRVEGWRVRLQELYTDGDETVQRALAALTSGKAENTSVGSTTLIQAPVKATLAELGVSWTSWFRSAKTAVASRLEEIFQQLQAEKPSLEAIATALNQLLLEQAAQQPLRITVAGATDIGPQHKHNEDSCFPTATDLPSPDSPLSDPLVAHLTVVCDGIGGHDGGEVASQLAVQSIKLQIRGMLAELAEDPELMTPELVKDQLAAIIRVANNLIAARNDEQERESRRRMGTTLVMALQLPQIVNTPTGSGNAHELYIANVGDSRAYWLTPRYCQQLTIDDDVVTREVRMGRSLLSEALLREDAGALTQAVGTKDAELLRPTVQRFILEEDGLLLLCSDGLSDNDRVEEIWASFTPDVLRGKLTVEAAVQSLIDLANQHNGHDNTSVVLSEYGVSPQYPVVLNFGELPTGKLEPETKTLETEFAQVAQSQEAEEAAARAAQEPRDRTLMPRRLNTRLALMLVAMAVFLSAVAGVVAWRTLDSQGYEQLRNRLFPAEVEESPES
jgi:protein phosphatase